MARLAVFNQKGGVGKTTTTLNLGAALARRGRNVLLVDLDPQAHLSAVHGAALGEAADSIYAFYQHARPLAELETVWEGIGRLIPAHAELIKVDSVFGKGPTILNRLNQGLNDLGTDRDERPVLIDCCPFLGVLSLNAVFAADRLLVPISSDYLALRGAMQVERTLEALVPVLKRRVERKFVLTRFDRRRKMSSEIRQRLIEQFGEAVCETVISENVALAEAPACNRDIFSHNAGSRGAQDYAALIDELLSKDFL